MRLEQGIIFSIFNLYFCIYYICYLYIINIWQVCTFIFPYLYISYIYIKFGRGEPQIFFKDFYSDFFTIKYIIKQNSRDYRMCQLPKQRGGKGFLKLPIILMVSI